MLTGWQGEAWGHSFPAMRSVVVQVENCEVALLVGYSPASGEATNLFLAKAAAAQHLSVQKTSGSRAGTDALGDLLAAAALGPLTLAVDGVPLVATSAQAKLSGEGSGERPAVVLLVTYALPTGGRLTLTSKEPRATRVTWSDKSAGRAERAAAPAQGSWHSGVASFLLPLSAGVFQCAAQSQLSARPSPRFSLSPSAR